MLVLILIDVQYSQTTAKKKLKSPKFIFSLPPLKKKKKYFPLDTTVATAAFVQQVLLRL